MTQEEADKILAARRRRILESLRAGNKPRPNSMTVSSTRKDEEEGA